MPFIMFKCVIFSILLKYFVISAKSCENSMKTVERIEKGITAWSKLDSLYYKPTNFNPEDYNYTREYQDAEHYDFIVIGSGASGAVVAGRLSEVPHWKVLLLEAGPEENELVDIPGTYSFLQNTQYDWGFETVPQAHMCASSSSICSVRAGKGLGGGTLVNGFQSNHGTPGDFDHWASLGFEDWSWQNVLPFYVRLEHANHIEYTDWEYHGRDGPVFIEDFRYHSNLSRYILDGGEELGFQVADYNGSNQTVYTLQYGTTHDGVRFTSAHAFLNKKIRRKRPNLTIKTESYALKIIMDEQQKTAKGVEYLQLKDNQLKVAMATKEVIVSAGAMKTAQILMLSGIGPKDHLESKNITTLVDLPVGSNFNNHPSYSGFSYTFDAASELFKNYTLHEVVQEYVSHRKGPLTNMGLDAVAYYPSDIFKNLTGPSIEFQFSIRQPGISGWAVSNQTTLVIEINVLHPFSRGNVSLNDSDPLHHPLIDPNYYGSPEDVEMVIEGIHRAMEFMNTTTMQSLGPNIILKYTDECGNLTAGDDFWRCSIKLSTTSLSHYCGSASMGLVVDERLKVYGVNNLRVIDGSILPVTISGHLMSPCYMIGEKGADIIRSDWKQQRQM